MRVLNHIANAAKFLTFFKMSIKFLAVAFVFAAAVLAPINSHFDDNDNGKRDNSTTVLNVRNGLFWSTVRGHKPKHEDRSYLWAYLVFTYVFSALAIYFMLQATHKVIRVRQDYLGSQSTITDRTIRLSGIPEELRSEEKIAEFLEKIEIGKVESVTLCRQWKEIDNLMDQRADILRKLEEAWTVHLNHQGGKKHRDSVARALPPPPSAENEDEEEEGSDGHENDNLMTGSNNHVTTYDKPRPTTRIWYGFMRLQSKKVDAIDYYEERLRKVDEKINMARKKEYKPTALAFVTMDSISACQMAVQAVLDPRPTQLLATLAPAPSDIVWTNTYLSRTSRMIRAWSISIFVVVLSIIWLIPVAPFASLLNLCSIRKVWPELGDLLGRHKIVRALVQTGLPTLAVSLLNIAVPFLYDYLSNMQGMISQSEVELSVISKNFFFTFFNIFFVFTAFGTATNIWGIWGTISNSLTDITYIAYQIARSLKSLGVFYKNFILLQGIGLFPVKLLEFGSVSLYPIMKLGAKTPRDYAELVQPPVFKYGFYLPTSLLILILCIVYSVLPAGYQVLFFGLIYFILGYYSYKYQLLYAMDHPQHATGRAWPMICYRIMLGLGIFQGAMAAYIALRTEFTIAAIIVPLIFFTIWFSYFYGRTYEPLTKYIALRCIRRKNDPDVNIADEILDIERPPGHIRRQSTTVDEDREKGQKFVNPSLVIP
jgi:calcium permeable stress-gated cation channel